MLFADFSDLTLVSGESYLKGPPEKKNVNFWAVPERKHSFREVVPWTVTLASGVIDSHDFLGGVGHGDGQGGWQESGRG